MALYTAGTCAYRPQILRQDKLCILLNSIALCSDLLIELFSGRHAKIAIFELPPPPSSCSVTFVGETPLRCITIKASTIPLEAQPPRYKTTFRISKRIREKDKKYHSSYMFLFLQQQQNVPTKNVLQQSSQVGIVNM